MQPAGDLFRAAPDPFGIVSLGDVAICELHVSCSAPFGQPVGRPAARKVGRAKRKIWIWRSIARKPGEGMRRRLDQIGDHKARSIWLAARKHLLLGSRRPRSAVCDIDVRKLKSCAKRRAACGFSSSRPRSSSGSTSSRQPRTNFIILSRSGSPPNGAFGGRPGNKWPLCPTVRASGDPTAAPRRRRHQSGHHQN